MGDEAGSYGSLRNVTMCAYGVELGTACVCMCMGAPVCVCIYVSVLVCVETETLVSSEALRGEVGSVFSTEDSSHCSASFK